MNFSFFSRALSKLIYLFVFSIAFVLSACSSVGDRIDNSKYFYSKNKKEIYYRHSSALVASKVYGADAESFRVLDWDRARDDEHFYLKDEREIGKNFFVKKISDGFILTYFDRVVGRTINVFKFNKFSDFKKISPNKDILYQFNWLSGYFEKVDNGSLE